MKAIIEKPIRLRFRFAFIWIMRYLEQVMLAIQSGFTSVMIDGSTSLLKINIAVCKRIAEAAHAVNVSVEGELGTIGSTDAQAEAGANTIIYTDPDAAVKFVEATGVDTLAIASAPLTVSIRRA